MYTQYTCMYECIHSIHVCMYVPVWLYCARDFVSETSPPPSHEAVVQTCLSGQSKVRGAVGVVSVTYAHSPQSSVIALSATLLALRQPPGQPRHLVE